LGDEDASLASSGLRSLNESPSDLGIEALVGGEREEMAERQEDKGLMAWERKEMITVQFETD